MNTLVMVERIAQESPRLKARITGALYLLPCDRTPSRRAPGTDTGRSLVARYSRRWRVERLFAWLHHFRRLVIRWEYHVQNFFSMVRLGCIQILLRQL